MTKNNFIMVSIMMYFGIINELHAECINNQTCGVDGHEMECCWEFNETNGKLTITGSGEMKNYSSGNNTPWSEFSNNINDIEIQGITSIGNKAFEDYSINNVTIGNSVIKIGSEAFWANDLTSLVLPNNLKIIGENAFESNEFTSLVIPNSVTDIKMGAFNSCQNLENLVIGDSVTNIEKNAFGDTNLKSIVMPDNNINIGEWALGYNFDDEDVLENLKIYCKGNIINCRENLDYYKNDGYNLMSLADNVQSADETLCVGNYYWNGKICINKNKGINCVENWKRNEDFCNRIRYTPAEAAEVLRNDNTNEVVITFKK